MTGPIHILDGGGTRRAANVNEKNALQVSQTAADVFAPGTPSTFRFLSQLVSSVGDGTGTTNMNVDGSSTPVNFTIGANQDFDIRILEILIFIVDGSETENAKFGGLSALSTGWDLKVIESEVSTFIMNKATTSGEIITSTNTPIFGVDNTKWNSVSLVDATDHAGYYVLNVGRLVPDGIRIGRGTKDRLESTVNDDLTGLTTFNVRALGYRHFP